MANTTSICNSFKVEVLQAGHCMNAPVATTATGSSTASWTSLGTVSGISTGMAVTGTNVAAGTIVQSIDSSTTMTVSKASTGAISNVTFTGDILKMALIKAGATGTYGA